jgi:hypothetical protein
MDKVLRIFTDTRVKDYANNISKQVVENFNSECITEFYSDVNYECMNSSKTSYECTLNVYEDWNRKGYWGECMKG